MELPERLMEIRIKFGGTKCANRSLQAGEPIYTSSGIKIKDQPILPAYKEQYSLLEGIESLFSSIDFFFHN